MKNYIARGAPPLLLLLLIIASTGYWACQKQPQTEEEKLPPATQEGKKTFGCLVDGKAWIAKGSGLIDPAVDVSYNVVLGEIYIYAQKFFKEFPHRQYIGLTLSDVKSPKEYELLPVINTWTDGMRDCSAGFNDDFISISGGRIVLSKVDTSSRIISGTFEFSAYGESCLDTVHITQGRFDLNY